VVHIVQEFHVRESKGAGAKVSDMVSGTRRVMGINFQVVGTALLGQVA
jgi:hypothetical protein